MAGDPSALFDQRPRHARRATIAIATLALAIAIPATALAGKGGGSSTPSWIALATVSGESVATAQPRLGTSVRFSSGYPTTTRNPWVSVTCWQGGALVWGQGGSPSAEFSLGGASSDWQRTGGAATCRAELGDLYWRGGRQYYTYLAHTSFEAAE